jgi:hypothetical protein
MLTTAPHNISIAELAAAGLRLRPVEAVTIARELTLRARKGELPGIPSASVLRFTSEGAIVCEGPVAAGQSVERAGRLLESLLPGFDAPPEMRVPGALRLVVARALNTLDLPAYPTLDGFAEALTRFAGADTARVVRGLVVTWRTAAEAARPEPAEAATATFLESSELTISDVRRARRSTGMPLAEIAERSRIPVSLLRELEWGYFVNWPAGQYGRSQLVRYARAAGLDVEVVTRAVWPVLDEAVRVRDARRPIVRAGDVGAPVIEDVAIPDRAGSTKLVKIDSAVPAHRASGQAPARRRLWLAALAIPALIAIGFVPTIWQSRAVEPAADVPTATVSAPPAARQPSPEATLSEGSQVRRQDVPPAAAPAVRGSQPPAQTVSAPEPAPVSAGPARLTDGPGRPDATFSPAFASVGSAMFYHAEAGDRSALMRADTDMTGAVLRVTSIVNDEARNFHARPSPDGAMIAFDSDREGERAVYVADAEGRNVRRVSGEGFSAVPSWSPDGRTLAFVRADANRPQVWNIWTVDLETGDTRRITSHRYGQPWGAAWFPDGQRIAYSHEDRLIIRSLPDGRERVFNTPKKGHLIRTPAVSPDGNRIMFQVHRDGAWLLDVSSGSMRRVLTDPTAEEFTWSPDGRRVAYHSRRAGGWGVWMMAAR